MKYLLAFILLITPFFTFAAPKLCSIWSGQGTYGSPVPANSTQIIVDDQRVLSNYVSFVGANGYSCELNPDGPQTNEIVSFSCVNGLATKGIVFGCYNGLKTPPNDDMDEAPLNCSAFSSQFAGTMETSLSQCVPADDNGTMCGTVCVGANCQTNQGNYFSHYFTSSSCNAGEIPDPQPDPDPDPEPEPDPDSTLTPPSPTGSPPTITTGNTNGGGADDELGAVNQSNSNLDVINNNIIASLESNNLRLDRIAEEQQQGNYLQYQTALQAEGINTKLQGLNSNVTSRLDSLAAGQYEGNQTLEEIKDSLNQEYNEGDCIGDYCDYDVTSKINEIDEQMRTFIEDDTDLVLPIGASNTLDFMTDYTLDNFAGFTGQCQPYDLTVSIRGVKKIISVGQHCEYYDSYFKPVLEWFLYTLTSFTLITMTMQTFRQVSNT